MEQILIKRAQNPNITNTFRTFSISGNETMVIEPEENTTIFISFEQNDDIKSTFPNLNTTITDAFFASDQNFTVTSKNNFSGFYWVLNETVCPGLIYLIDTEQYIFSERTIMHTTPENLGMCMFFNLNNYSGKLLAAAFGNKFRADVYSYNENTSLKLITSCTNEKCNKETVSNPFFIRLDIISDESYFYYALDLDSSIKNKCSETPIKRITKNKILQESQKYVKASCFCTNNEGYITGQLVLIFVAAGIVVVAISLCVGKIIDSKNDEKYQKFD